MTEDHKRLLAVFDVRVRDLMEFCDRQKEKINELESSLAQKEGELHQAMKTIEELNAKCDNLILALFISPSLTETTRAVSMLSHLAFENIEGELYVALV